jgi:hypothetical protein
VDKTHNSGDNDGSSIRLQGLKLVSDPLFDDMASTARSWLQECDETHEKCQQYSEIRRSPSTGSETMLPTRLLNIRLVDGRLRIRLCQPGKLTIRYSALSHCWGGSDLIKTTKDKYEAYQIDIPLSLLSPTLLQAAQITHEVGLSHLWIDSLCIIQDDPNDWSHEALRMVRIPFRIRLPFGYFPTDCYGVPSAAVPLTTY